jgi:hypothetical protein
METRTVPPPAQIQQRIADCEAELKALRRMLRLSRAMRDAEVARAGRTAAREKGGARRE